MVASIPCDQGTHGQKIIPERRTVWGDFGGSFVLYVYFKGKGGLWTLFRLLSSVGGAVLVGMAHGDGW